MAAALQAPVLPFIAQPAPERKTAPEPSSVTPIDATGNLAADHTLLELDRELDLLFDRMQDELEETGVASPESVAAFHRLCDAFGDKVDRIGRFIRVMEAREAYCKGEAARLTARANSAGNKVAHAKSLVLYYLQSRNIKKMEGKQFTLRRQPNSQDTVKITDENVVPFEFKRVEARFAGGAWEQLLAAVPDAAKPLLAAGLHTVAPMNDAIKLAVAGKREVPGAVVSRGQHVRVA